MFQKIVSFELLTNNADPDKYSYSGYGIEFDSRSVFSNPIFDWSKTIFIFGAGNSSSVHMDNKKNDILKDSEIKLYILCLGSIPNDFTANYMKKHDQMVTCTICPLNIILLKLVILSIFIKL